MADEVLEQALRDLLAESETTRLKGARALQGRGTGGLSTDDERAIREALAKESVPWVRGPLMEALVVNDPLIEIGVVIPAPQWDERMESLDPDLARQALNMSAKRVLHEVSAVVGRSRVAAKRELGDSYAESDTARQLEYLSDVCTGLRTLTGATTAPALAEFDLSAELQALASSVFDNLLFPIHVDGPAPFVVESDWNLLHLAVRNILVNAVEATQTLGPASQNRAIILTWGLSANGAHVTVIDRGPGPSSFLVGVGSAGVSTKEGHPGYGLATASEAMRSLGGTVQLQRNDQGGATVVLSWRES